MIRGARRKATLAARKPKFKLIGEQLPGRMTMMPTPTSPKAPAIRRGRRGKRRPGRIGS